MSGIPLGLLTQRTIRRSFYQFKWKLFAQLNPSDGDYDERSTMASGARTHTP
jgi:hypothetical protein